MFSCWLAPRVDWWFAFRNREQMLGSHEWCVSGVPVHYMGVLGMPTAFGGRRLLANELVSRRLGAWFAKFGRPTIAHVHWGWAEASQAAMEHLLQLDVPYVLTEHSSQTMGHAFLPQKVRDRYRRLAGCAVGVTAVGEELADAVSRVTGRGDVMVVPNPVDPTFRPQECQAPLSEDLRLVTVGTGSVKRIDRLVAALAQARLGRTGCTLTIVGRRGSLHGHSSSSAGSISIRRVEHLSSDDLALLFQQSDAYVCASDQETFGAAPIEAAACGAGLIAVECGPPARAARLGLGIATSRSVDGLRKAIEEFADAIAQWRQSRSDRALLVQRHFGLKVVGARFAQLLSDSARSRREGSRDLPLVGGVGAQQGPQVKESVDGD